MFKIFVHLTLVLALLLSQTISVNATTSANSRTIEIYSTEGTVTMTRGATRDFVARTGMLLHDGFTVTTGAGSRCYLQLDDGSLIRMDADSTIQINLASRNLLSISVLSGGLAVDAKPQSIDQEIEIRIGTSALAIRGTFFAAESLETGSIIFTMFEGYGVVDGVYLPQGHILLIEDGAQQHLPVTFDFEDASAFVLELILSDVSRFISNETIKYTNIERITELYAFRQGDPLLFSAMQQGSETNQRSLFYPPFFHASFIFSIFVFLILIIFLTALAYVLITKHKRGSGILYDIAESTVVDNNGINTASTESPSSPEIKTFNAPDGTVGTQYSYEFTATGSPRPKWTYTGKLPSGLTAITTESLLLFGTPTEAGEFTFTITASNTQGYFNQTLTIVISSPSMN